MFVVLGLGLGSGLRLGLVLRLGLRAGLFVAGKKLAFESRFEEYRGFLRSISGVRVDARAGV